HPLPQSQLHCLILSSTLPALNNNSPSLTANHGTRLCPNTTTRASGNSCRATFTRLCESPRICTIPILQCPTTISRLIGSFSITSSSSTLPCTAITGAIVSNSSTTESTERSPAWIINST